MARMGKKVLLIDLDGQANLTLYFIPNEDEVQASIFDSLVDGAPLPVKHIRENLDLVPSSLEMASAEIALTNLLAREQLLSRLLEPVKQNYDYILIDCPPSLGIVTTNAFLAADENDSRASSSERNENARFLCLYIAASEAEPQTWRRFHSQIQPSQIEQGG